MLYLVSEESKGKIKWKSTYQDAKWLFLNGKFRHDFYFVVAYMLYLYCSFFFFTESLSIMWRLSLQALESGCLGSNVSSFDV